MKSKSKFKIIIVVGMLLGVVFGAKAFFSEGELIQGSIESEKISGPFFYPFIHTQTRQ
ncbi:MAG: hypothetical protein US66_C0015G0017 [Candidatus Moranbacteria bacterium GW2011_GWD2_37_9]|nr:MAG: hypothetical protein US66_C0015G0017 [Candidatus Moranbacteria bacterium GW2011_GWD2_37_9]